MNSIGDGNLGNSFLSIKSSIELFCSDCVLEFSKDEISFKVVWLFSSSIGVTFLQLEFYQHQCYLFQCQC